jgi:hypothetical protein
MATDDRVADRLELTTIVRRLVGDDRSELVTWDQEALGWMNLMDARLHRVSGTATVGQPRRRREISWAIVRKTFPPPPSGAPALQPARWDYWKREVIVYASGVLDELGGDFSVPRCLGVTDDHDGSLSLWLEEISGISPDPWPISRYQAAAYAFAKFNARYLAGRPNPTEPSLGAGGLRSWVDAGTDFIETDVTWWTTPLMKRAFPAFEDVLRVINDAPALLAALDRMPQTFVHRDAWPGNLLVQTVNVSTERLVVIDWAICGQGAIGEEPAGMVGPTLWHFLVEPAAASELEGAVFGAYLAGLRDGGWTGDEKLLRFGFTASLALRFAVLIPPWVGAGWLTENPDWTERKFGRPIDAIVDGWSELMRFLLKLCDEARALGKSLRLI